MTTETKLATTIPRCPDCSKPANIPGYCAPCAARRIETHDGLLSALELAVATIEREARRHGPFSSVDGTLSVARTAISKARGN